MTLNVQRITGTTAKLAARLCNFVTAQSFLLPDHINFLDDEVAPIIRAMHGAWVDMFGYASRRSDTNFNQGLSERRVNAVKSRISEYANQVNFQISTALGESESGPNESDNSGYYRAVEVYVYATKPPLPKPTPKILPGGTDFKIRVVGGFSASVPVIKGPQVDQYVFQIVDKKNRKTMFFSYTAVGIALPSMPGLPGSFTKAGPFAEFQTSSPVQLFQFEGPASLFQDPGATAGSKSVGGTFRLSFETNKLLREGNARVLPTSTVPMEGGPGLQTPSSGSSSPGVLVKQTTEFPFTD